MNLNMEKEIDIIGIRRGRIEEDFDSYMAARLEMEKVVTETILTLLTESLGVWNDPPELELKDNENYVLRERGKENSLELGAWDKKQCLFWVEDRAVYIEPEKVEVLV